MKGNLVLAAPRSGDDPAREYFTRSLELSRRQGARAWELRTAIDLAALLAACGEREPARELLQPLFESFVEGSDTPDLKSAARLLATLS